MYKSKAKEISKDITNDEIKEMFDNAKHQITDWEEQSKINRNFTKGVAWNILASDFKTGYKYNPIVKLNMIREFGNYLPQDILDEYPSKNETQDLKPLYHQEPKFKK